MKRIKALLAKGIENLDEAEKAELMGLLSPEKLAELSDEDAVEVKTLVGEAANALLDDEDSSDATLATLEELANILDVIVAEETRRADAKTEADEKKNALRERIRGEAEGGEDDENADPPAPPEEPAEGDDDKEVEIEIIVPVDETVTASTVPAQPRRTPVRQNGPSPKPRQGNVRQAVLTAAAGLPGMHPGQKLDTDDKLFAAWDSAVRLAMGSRSDAFTMPVITQRVDIPEDMQLDRNTELNAQKIAARSGPEAIVAAGGACAPVPYRYDLQTVGNDTRPVRDALARFGAQRGGVSLFTPPTITDVMGTGATTAAVSEWTYNNDVTPGSDGFATKPYLRIECGNNDPSVTRVNAIVESYESGNMLERWYPELIQAYQRLIGVYHARYAEAKNLAGIAAGSKVVTHGQLLGTASDLFIALDQLIVGIRFRHRIVEALPIRVIGFEWVRKSIIADLIRRGSGDRPLEERIRMAQSEVDGFFASHNVNITWSPDFQFGRTIGQPGGPIAGTQGVGPVIGYPSVARFYVHMEGSWLFLDGGEFNAGVMRDVTKVRTNDWVFFSETFENVAYDGVPGETYVYDIDVCANGGYSSALDINPCTSNS